MKKLLRYFLIIAMLWNVRITDAETLKQRYQDTHAAITMTVRGETQNTDYAEGDVLLAPTASTQLGNLHLGYGGTFRKTVNTDGETSELQTFVHKANVGNDTWDLTVGRDSFREFGSATTTIGFDNYMSGRGVSRCFTGVFVGHQPSHLRLGIASSDTTLSPSHWDSLLGSWSHRFDDRLGIQVHGAATKDHLDKAGLALEWRPTDRVTLLSDLMYSRSESSASLIGNWQASDRLKVFAGAEVTDPSDSSATGKVVVGAEGNLGHGVKAIGAVEQELSSDGQTIGVLGLKFQRGQNLL